VATRNRRKLKPEDITRTPVLAKRYRIWDTAVPGLFVSVQPSGVKSFNVQWSRTGSKSIGKFPGLTLEAARTQAHDILSDARKHGTPAVAARRTKVEVFADYITNHYEPWVVAETKSGKATVANIRAQFGELFDTKPLTDITAWQIEKFKARRLKAGIKPATVNRDLDRIRAAMAKAVEWNLLSANPLTTVKRSKVEDEDRIRYLDAAENARLRKAIARREDERRQQRARGNAWAAARGRELRPEWAPDEFTDHLAPLVLLALNTGLRRGELFGLTWEAVDVARGQLRVAAATAKSRRARHVPLNSEARDVIQRLMKHSVAVGLIFRGASGARMTHINRSWAGLVNAAKVANFHFHDCRHHFASQLVMSGADLYVVKELLGHSDFAMTQRYAHLSPEHKAAAVEKLVASK
jgi:integrase